MPTPHVIFQLATPKTQADAASRWEQVLSGIPQLTDRWYHTVLGKREHVSVEILWHHGQVRYYITCPERIAQGMYNLVSGVFPEALLMAQTEDPLATLVDQGPDAVRYFCRLEPNKTTFEQFSTDFSVDPLSGFYAYFASLPSTATAMLQIVLSPTVITTIKKAAVPETATPAESNNTKGFYITWRVGVSLTGADQFSNPLDHIPTTFNLFTQSSQSFFKRVRLGNQHTLLSDIFNRTATTLFTKPFSIKQTALVSHPPGADMATIPNIAWGKRLAGEPPQELPIVWKGQDPTERADVNPFATTIFKNQPVVYGLRQQDRRRHMYVIGKTGTGKSTLLANMVINDLKSGRGLCVIDPNGDLVETLLDYIPSHRINDVIYFDPADTERTVKLNLFEGKNVVHRELIASGIISVFRKLYGYSWGPRLEHILRNCLLTLLKAEDSKLSDIVDLLTDKDFRQKIVEKLDDPILTNFWINEFESMQDKFRTEAIAPVLNKIGQFVSSPLIRDVVNVRKSSFSVEEVMDEGKILLVNLSQGKLGEDNAALLGAMLITKIQLAAMARAHVPEEDRRDFYLYVDEFQNFATESFTKILSEARKYHLNLILANQYTAQLPEEVRKSIFGNCGSIFTFVVGADDAQIFSQEFSGKYTADDLVNLEKHQIINRLSIDNVISQPFSGYTLPLASSANKNRAKVLVSSRERYARKR